MNLILTSTSGGLSAAEIRPFFESLRLSGCKGRVAVFAGNISGDCRSLLAEHRAEVIDVNYQGIPTLSRRSDRLRRGFAKVRQYYRQHRGGEKECSHLFFNNARFFWYRDYLQALPEQPHRVLLADIRDVVFQTDPFAFPFEDGLSVATEKTRRRILHSWCAVKGLYESVGLIETCRHLRRNIICAGTTVADHDTLRIYLERMVSGIQDRFLFGLLEGIDQGLHTHLVHRRQITPVHCFRNWEGPFLTLDREVILPKHKNSEGYLCNEDGSVIPIVHQYDRIQQLFREGEPRPPCWRFLGDTPSAS
jgi:hypothetical protein